MVIFFDIDGTLVDEQTQIIPQSTVRAIDALRQKGHTPIINTGRPYSHIDPRVRRLPFSGWVCSGGLEVCLNGQWLQRISMGPQLSRWVIDTARDHRMQVIYEAEGGFILDGEFSNDPRILLESERLLRHGCFVKQVVEFSEPDIIKFVTFDQADSRHKEFVEIMSRHLHCIERGKTMVEYVMQGHSKAAGMELLLRHMNTAKADIFAFGDSTNDIPMFRAAGHSICMGNGMDEAKAQAHYITASVLEDGIEKALKHYGLID